MQNKNSGFGDGSLIPKKFKIKLFRIEGWNFNS